MNTFEFQNAVLRLTYEVGVDANGKAKFVSKNYRNTRPELTANQISAVANALASLTIYPLTTIAKVQTEEIVTN